MTHRFKAVLTILTLFATAVAARAGESTVAVFLNPEIGPYRAVLEGFRKSCNCTVVEYPVRDDTSPDPAATVRAGKADLILTIGLDALLKASEIRNTPLLATMVPRAQARKAAGRALAGIDMTLSPEAYLEAVLRLFPAAKHIGVIYDPANTGEYVHEAVRAAAARGLQLVAREATRTTEVPALLASLRPEIDILWMLPDPTVVREETLGPLLQFSFENKVPLLSFARKYVAMGALAALTVDPFEIGLQAGEKAPALQAGPATPSFDYIRKRSLVVNRKVGKKMGFHFNLEALGEAADAID